MDLKHLLIVVAYVVAGTLPWFTLGPASTLGVMGWTAGIAAALAGVAGIGAGVFGMLAAKGMPAKAGSAGPRLTAFLLSAASLLLTVVWLSTSGNTQAMVGASTQLLYYGPGASFTLIVALVAVAVTGHALVLSREALPEPFLRAATSIRHTFTSNPGDRSNHGRTQMDETARKEDPGVAPHRAGLSSDLHMPAARDLQSPETGSQGEAPASAVGVRPQELASDPTAAERSGAVGGGGVPGAGRREPAENGDPSERAEHPRE